MLHVRGSVFSDFFFCSSFFLGPNPLVVIDFLTFRQSWMQQCGKDLEQVPAGIFNILVCIFILFYCTSPIDFVKKAFEIRMMLNMQLIHIHTSGNSGLEDSFCWF